MATKKHHQQELAYEFLSARPTDGSFHIDDLVRATGWTSSTARTHIGKHYGDWVKALGNETYKVLPEFKRVTKEQFLRHCSQVRRVYTDYLESRYTAISVFEFLLPMSRETQLRATLDGLFFADALHQRFDELGARLESLLPKRRGEPADEYRERWLTQVSNWFGGYSIALVNGRFRAASLRTRREAVEHQMETGRPYLIDETTASVRFIVPLPASKTGIDDDRQLDLDRRKNEIVNEARRIRETFFAVFVEAVIRIVNGEDVIWLVEDSPLGKVLHTWEYEGGH